MIFPIVHILLVVANLREPILNFVQPWLELKKVFPFGCIYFLL